MNRKRVRSGSLPLFFEKTNAPGRRVYLQNAPGRRVYLQNTTNAPGRGVYRRKRSAQRVRSGSLPLFFEKETRLAGASTSRTRRTRLAGASTARTRRTRLAGASTARTRRTRLAGASTARSGVNRGFTLIELLTVISILSILMALALVGINAARGRGDEVAVATDLKFLSAAIQQFSEETGDFPPTRLGDIDRKLSGNGINDGNESLFGFLLTRKRGGPFAELEEDRWVNSDLDQLSGAQMKIVKKEIDWVRGTAELLEYVDIWGNPYVYIHNRDYDASFSCQSPEGLLFEAKAQRNPTTGTYYAPTTFQLWSLGPDGINDNGGGDDIVSWN